mmetsp:Transcript_25683/g.59918  ORF Transcript_25683/g.59918 Transcript_25683/m.59918 type:complete len:254 (-) Transcript_25683:370-1131(-)
MKTPSRGSEHSPSLVPPELGLLEGDLRLCGILELLQVLDTCKLDHRGWAAHEHKGAVVRRREVLGDHLLGDVTRRVGPALARLIDRVPDLELRGMLRGQLIEHLPHQDVRLGLIGVQQRNSRLVSWVLQDGRHHLQHRRDARAPSHHPQLGAHELLAANLELAVAKVLVDAPWARDVNRVAHLERLHVLRHLASVREVRLDATLVHLNDKVDEADVVVRAGRRVLALDLVLVSLGVIAAIPLPCDRRLRIWRK